MFFDIDKCDIFLYDCELKIVTYADNILYICEPSMKFILDFYVTWLSHGQLLATVDGAASLTRC